MSSKPEIEFSGLKAQQAKLRPKIDSAIARVLDHGNYILGPEVAELEKKLAEFCGARHALTCSSGTDALALVLMAKGIKVGDAVFVPSFTFAATAEVVAWLGATPVFVDILENTFNIDFKSLDKAIDIAKSSGLMPAAVILVDLFGLPADYEAIVSIAQKHDLWVMADAAQSFGSSYKGKKTGTLGLATAISFFPAKPLGCYGDGGAIFTDDDPLYAALQSLRVHGKGEDKYDNVRIGMNARLDTLQAAILLEKLAVFEWEIGQRQRVSERYNANLSGIVTVPEAPKGLSSAWAQYTVVCKSEKQRSEWQSLLKQQHIPTAIYYPKPLHQQTAYTKYPTAGRLTVCEDVCHRVLSLPMHPYLSNADIDAICGVLQSAKIAA